MDDEKIIYVDADTREAVLHSNFKIGVVNDDSCHTLTFRINKDSDIDLTDLTFYVNTTSSRGNCDRLDCTKEEDEQYIFVKCLLKGTLFEAKGKATINLCGRKYDSNNAIIKKWGSEDITVLVGSHTDADKAIEERYPSVLEDLKSKIENLNITDEQINTIATKVAEKGFYTKSEIDSMIADIDLSSYQTKTDDTLTTTSKEVVGAINENTSNITKLKSDLEQLKQSGTGTGLSTEAINKLEEVGNYLTYTTADGGAKWTELIDILRNGSSGGGSGETEKTLSSISATYTGGDVTVGTALTSLTGITVTATYTDGTTKTITGYTLSGEILDGENTITVSYSGLTTTFTVTGIVESSEVTAELPKDGLVAYFDFRNTTPEINTKQGFTKFNANQGNGCLFTWSASVFTSSDDYGVKMARTFMFDKDGGTNQSEFGTSFSMLFKGYDLVNGCFASADHVKPSNLDAFYSAPKYNTSSSQVQLGPDGVGDMQETCYIDVYFVVDGSLFKLYVNGELAKSYNGTNYEDFVSWYSKVSAVVLGSGNYQTALAIYEKALSEVEITEARAFLKTLEVA